MFRQKTLRHISFLPSKNIPLHQHEVACYLWSVVSFYPLWNPSWLTTLVEIHSGLRVSGERPLFPAATWIGGCGRCILLGYDPVNPTDS